MTSALSLSIVKNKTAQITFSIFKGDGSGDPQSLAGTVLFFHAASGAFTLSKDSNSHGITITNPAGGADCATMKLDPADTAALVIPGVVLTMPCELTLQAGSDEFEIGLGSLQVWPNVGTP